MLEDVNYTQGKCSDTAQLSALLSERKTRLRNSGGGLPELLCILESISPREGG